MNRMTKILYVTDPGISAKSQIDVLGKFLGAQSKKHTPDLVVVAGDYIDIPDLLRQQEVMRIVEQVNCSEQEAAHIVEAKEAQSGGIPYWRPKQTIAGPSYSLDQMPELYLTMIQAIEMNTSCPIVLNAGNHDLQLLQVVLNYQNSTRVNSGRVYNPEFTVQEINGLRVAGMPGSCESIPFLDSPNYVWDGSIGAKFIELMRAKGSGKIDLLLTHMPPEIQDTEQVLGFGSDRIPDWNFFRKSNVLTSDGDHVGYPITRSLVELMQPSLVLCGHIEEARHARDNTLHAGAVDLLKKSVVVNPGGFHPNWFEKEPVAALVNYADSAVRLVSFIVGEDVVHSISSFDPKPLAQPKKRLEELLQ